jgi:hypothetical protein
LKGHLIRGVPSVLQLQWLYADKLNVSEKLSDPSVLSFLLYILTTDIYIATAMTGMTAMTAFYTQRICIPAPHRRKLDDSAISHYNRFEKSF